jgi:hypothetical protein
MDFNEVNTAFVHEAIAFCLRNEALILDAVTGSAPILVLISQMQP